MSITRIVATLVVLATCGCGVRFASAPTNVQIPEAFTKRCVYPGGVAGYDFYDLVGNVLVLKNGEDPFRIGVIRPTEYINTVIPITESNNFYRSRIQLGAEVQGAYLAFAAKFSAEDMAELTLDDIARAGIEFRAEATWDEITDKIVAWVKEHPNVDAGSSRLWIKSVVLSRRVYNGYTKIDGNASGQVGDVTGVKAGVYRKDDEGIKSVILGFEAFDVDRLASEISRKYAAPPFPDDMLERTRYIGVLEGTIKER